MAQPARELGLWRKQTSHEELADDPLRRDGGLVFGREDGQRPRPDRRVLVHALLPRAITMSYRCSPTGSPSGLGERVYLRPDTVKTHLATSTAARSARAASLLPKIID